MKKTEQTESTLQIEHRLGILEALLLIFLLAFIPVAFLTDNQLTCERIEPSAPVNCEMWKVFSGIPLYKKSLPDLQPARVVRHKDSDGDISYRVMLYDGSGRSVKFNSSGSSSSAESTADKINAFLQDRDRPTMSMGGQTILPPICGITIIIAIPLLILFGVQFIQQTWTFDRVNNRLVHQRGSRFSRSIFKPKEFPLDQVSAVRLDTHTDSDGDKTYQIILTVSSKRIKLPSSSSQSKEFNLAQEIKDFLGL